MSAGAMTATRRPARPDRRGRGYPQVDDQFHARLSLAGHLGPKLRLAAGPVPRRQPDGRSTACFCSRRATGSCSCPPGPRIGMWSFKLHAPRQTTVEVTLKDGKVTGFESHAGVPAQGCSAAGLVPMIHPNTPAVFHENPPRTAAVSEPAPDTSRAEDDMSCHGLSILCGPGLAIIRFPNPLLPQHPPPLRCRSCARSGIASPPMNGTRRCRSAMVVSEPWSGAAPKPNASTSTRTRSGRGNRMTTSTPRAKPPCLSCAS